MGLAQKKRKWMSKWKMDVTRDEMSLEKITVSFAEIHTITAGEVLGSAQGATVAETSVQIWVGVVSTDREEIVGVFTAIVSIDVLVVKCTADQATSLRRNTERDLSIVCYGHQNASAGW